MDRRSFLRFLGAAPVGLALAPAAAAEAYSQPILRGEILTGQSNVAAVVSRNAIRLQDFGGVVGWWQGESDGPNGEQSEYDWDVDEDDDEEWALSESGGAA